MAVHPSAIVHPAAKIDPSADVGPFCIVGEEVEIGAGTRLMAHIYVEGPTWIGEGNTFYGRLRDNSTLFTEIRYSF